MGTIWKRGRCRFCGAACLVIDNMGPGDFPAPPPGTARWSVGHEEPKCPRFDAAIRKKQPAIIEDPPQS